MSLPDTDPKFFAELSKDPCKVQPLDLKLSRQHATPFTHSSIHNTELTSLGSDDMEPPFPSIDDDDENIPTADIIAHITEGRQLSNYLVSVATEAECADNLPEDELEEPTSTSDSGSGSDFKESEDDELSLLIPTITQGQSAHV
jgi:hypothetical protein